MECGFVVEDEVLIKYAILFWVVGLTGGHPSHFILLLKWQQQLYLVGFELNCLAEDCPNCGSSYSEFSVGCSGWLLQTVNKCCSDSVHLLFTCWQLVGAFSLADTAVIQEVVVLASDRLLWLWVLLGWWSEWLLCCSHKVWLMKPETASSFFLWCHFRLTMVAALQQPVSELPYVTVSLGIVSLHVPNSLTIVTTLLH
jgi:hypothetical protein